MNLRPYQERAVSAVCSRLETEQSTLLVAPTGAGKTILMAAIGERRPGRILVLQHREELVAQNRAKFCAYNRGAITTLYTAAEKRFAPYLPDQHPVSATFAMVPTLSRPAALKAMRPVDLIMADEAHHAPASTWRAVIDRCLELNPNVKLVGVTATPNRADKQGLGSVFKSVAEVIQIGELIENGFLVRPKAHVAEIGLADQIRGVRRATGGDFDMGEVARLIDHEPITRRVVDLWREHAGDRQTIVFASTVAHARHVAEVFALAGIPTGVVTGEDDPAERAKTIRDLAACRLQVVVNCMALTEGFDDQLISCVVLLRPSCFESTLIQMIGRGLRTVDPALYPGVVKDDCIVLDFGASLSALGSLEQILNLDGREKSKREPGPPPMKPCESCRAAIPMASRECFLCGYVYPLPKAVMQPSLITPESITLRPLDVLMSQTKFAWIDLPDRDGVQRRRTKVATSGKPWALVTTPRNSGRWAAFFSDGESRPRYLGSGDLELAMNLADAQLAQVGDAKKYGRGSFYMRQAPSDAQKQLAAKRGIKVRDGATMYEVGCWITADLNRAAIAAIVRDVVLDDEEAAA